MGNLLSIFRPRSRRRPLPGRRSQAPIARESPQPGPAQPAAPAPTPGPFRFLFSPQQSRGPSPVSFYSAPRKPCPLPPDTDVPLGLLPAVGGGLPSRKKPVLSARNSMMLGHPSSVRIPPPSSQFPLQLPSPREQVAGAGKLIPIPARLPNKTKVRTQGKPRAVIEEEGQVERRRSRRTRKAPSSPQDIHIQDPGDPGRPQFLQVQSGAP